jgi:hypothetical protein
MAEPLADQVLRKIGEARAKAAHAQSSEALEAADALDNITFDEASGQQALQMFGDEYLLRYMLRWESKKNETFLDVEGLQSPFSYKLRIHRDGESREQPVDLAETFAWMACSRQVCSGSWR